MKRLLLAFAVAAGFGGITPAQACTSGIFRAYFFREPPPARDDEETVRVRIVARSDTEVSAMLVGPYAQLSRDGHVAIRLPVYPQGTNCVNLGQPDGDVYVRGALRRTGEGALSMTAALYPEPYRGIPHAADYCQYIVDPAYRSDCPRGRAPGSPPRRP